jgi:hypothetical protein
MCKLLFTWDVQIWAGLFYPTVNIKNNIVITFWDSLLVQKTLVPAFRRLSCSVFNDTFYHPKTWWSSHCMLMPVLNFFLENLVSPLHIGTFAFRNNLMDLCFMGDWLKNHPLLILLIQYHWNLNSHRFLPQQHLYRHHHVLSPL